jgi:hypothetical protein
LLKLSSQLDKLFNRECDEARRRAEEEVNFATMTNACNEGTDPHNAIPCFRLILRNSCDVPINQRERGISILRNQISDVGNALQLAEIFPTARIEIALISDTALDSADPEKSRKVHPRFFLALGR